MCSCDRMHEYLEHSSENWSILLVECFKDQGLMEVSKLCPILGFLDHLNNMNLPYLRGWNQIGFGDVGFAWFLNIMSKVLNHVQN